MEVSTRLCQAVDETLLSLSARHLQVMGSFCIMLDLLPELRKNVITFFSCTTIAVNLINAHLCLKNKFSLIGDAVVS